MNYFEERSEKVPWSGCWIWSGHLRPNGYGWMSRTALGTEKLAHRVAWIEANGQRIPAGLRICHRCDVRSCVNPLHLFIATQGENLADMVRKGRSAKGERHGHAKLTEGQVVEIKRRLQCGERNKDLADQFRVNKRTIADIKQRRCWVHL